MILDARYEKARVDHVIQSRGAMIRIGIDWEQRGQFPGVKLANLESCR